MISTNIFLEVFEFDRDNILMCVKIIRFFSSEECVQLTYQCGQDVIPNEKWTNYIILHRW